MVSDELVFNGVDVTTGRYLSAPSSAKDLVGWFSAGETEGGDARRELKKRLQEREPAFAVGHQLNPDDLAQVGWGLVMAVDANPDVREALRPLLTHRQAQAGQRYFEFVGPKMGLRPDDTKYTFLGRNDMGPGTVNPKKVPYYLLLVGGPAEIDLRLQYELDVQYAVGRLHFPDLEDYACYAAKVVSAERSPRRNSSRRIVLFGTKNPDDPATHLSVELLVEPLGERLVESMPNWEIDQVIADAATKENLSRLVCGADAPSILFTATHGVALPNGNDRQRETQGALLCQEWPGPLAWEKPVGPDSYFAAVDVPHDLKQAPEVIFSYSCYGVGTPSRSEFPAAERQGSVHSADPITPFISRLPQRLLGHSRGPLAFVGHVERTWSCSFRWGKTGSQTGPFEEVLSAAGEGCRVGHAMEAMNLRYAELGTSLNETMDRIRKDGFQVPDAELAGLWTANNDARNYAVLGDPAVQVGAALETAPR